MENTMVKMVLDAWHSTVKRADALIDQLTDDQLSMAVAPGRNSGKYLLGHLAVAHDHMRTLFNLGEALHPSMLEAFIRNPDGPAVDAFAVSELRNAWKTVNTDLANGFSTMTAGDWFLKHNSVSAEDFEKEPHRNRLNVLISRTNHLSYHLGQMVFLKG